MSNEHFPAIGTTVEGDVDDFHPVDSIESLCMECHEQVSFNSQFVEEGTLF